MPPDDQTPSAVTPEGRLPDAEYAQRFAAAVLASDPDFRPPLGDVELLDSWAEEVEGLWFVRTTYRSSFYPGLALGIRVRVPEEPDVEYDPATFVPPDPEQAGTEMADDFMLWEPLGRTFDLLVEEEGVWWWGDGYPDLDQHPDFLPFKRGGCDMADWYVTLDRIERESPFGISALTSSRARGNPSVYSAFADEESAGRVLEVHGVYLRETGWITGRWRLEIGLSSNGPWFAFPVWVQLLREDPELPPQDWAAWLLGHSAQVLDLTYEDGIDNRLREIDGGRTSAGVFDSEP